MMARAPTGDIPRSERIETADPAGSSEAAESVTAPRSLARSVALPSLAVAGGIGALDLLRKRFQKSQLFLPDRYPNGIWDPRGYGLEVEDSWFESGDGVQLHGWWIEVPRAQGTLLYCHGNSGSIAHRIGVLRSLRRLKLNLFAFDYRGYGRSLGEPSEAGLCRDARAAHDHLTAQRGIATEKVLLFGHSLGGAVAVDAALHRPAAGLIVQSSFTDVRSMARCLHPRVPLHWIASNQFRSVAKVDKLTLPKLFVHGTEDGTVPFAMGRELFEAAAGPKDFFAVPNAGHNDVEQHGGGSYIRRLQRFAKSSLTAA